MLPLQQAKEVRQSVIDYIKATFRFKEQAVGDAFYRFIEDRGNGMFKGPYISLKTPFIAASDEESKYPIGDFTIISSVQASVESIFSTVDG